ncbi:hypothetical protein [uncultured Ruegeria sp.]|uniref:hypothetical protein n=2 Tax=uncultured Ruegeria sp. TaxID=259304 RepID=UPI0026036398|nr:hypothetical protein [uncultured Ruegeria sp.]
MGDALSNALRKAAKGSGWSIKQDMLSKQNEGYAFSVHPRRGALGCIEFRAKPIVWDTTLWSILQIEGNEAKPVSFRFSGAFTCDCPALIQEAVDDLKTNPETAEKMVELSSRALEKRNIWQGYDLSKAAEREQPQQLYRYHITHVVDQICRGDHQSAQQICTAALNGDLDLRHTLYSTDKLAPTRPDGSRESRSFFKLAQLWMDRF